MANKKETALTTAPTAEQLALLNQEFPKEQGFTRISVSRLGMISQDVIEETKNPKTGKKEVRVTTEAGTFFIEQESDEQGENGKRTWTKEELGTSLEVTIIFQRKQLKYYDEKTETFTSSSVYDSDDEIIPLWSNKAEVARGTPAELKARPEYEFEKDGKTKSKLEENRILYVIYEGKLYQMNLRGSSMFSWLNYSRKVLPSAVRTALDSTSEAKGKVVWNKMSFTKVRDLDGDEINEVIGHVGDIKDAITQEKSFFATQTVEKSATDKAWDAIPE